MGNNINTRIKIGSDDVSEKHTNRLINEKSPYLLQHAYNPVDWYPWNDEAFKEKGEIFDPKFPRGHNLMFLTRYYKENNDKKALEMIEKTLDGMYKGGIFDHIGFGFFRYSVDNKWLVPHFEKTLYDNALLAYAYLEGYQATGKELYKEVAEKIFTYIIHDMTSDEGVFYSAEDADSEGEEGKFYVWSKDEIKSILGDEEGEVVCNYFDITDAGNFEGGNIPNLIKHDLKLLEKSPDLINRVHAYADMLFYKRDTRIRPHKDDKILTSWNGLMIAAFSYGGRILNKNLFINVAKKSIDFIYNNLFDESGRLLSRYRDGEARYKGNLEDYAFLTWGLIELYEATYEKDYLEKAKKLMDETFKLFWDDEKSGFFINNQDGSILSGDSIAAFNMIKLSKMLEDESYRQKYEEMIKSFGENIKQMTSAHSFFLISYIDYKTTT